MTKRELLAQLTSEPILVEPVQPLTYYRIAPHSETDPNAGVWVALASIGGTLVVQDYHQVHAVIGGRVVRLTYRETEAVVARLRRLFGKNGGGSRTIWSAPSPGPRRRGKNSVRSRS